MDIDEEELRETFDHFDRDNNNRIDKAEFAELLAALGADMSDEETAIGFSVVDRDNSGSIDYREFRAWWGAQ